MHEDEVQKDKGTISNDIRIINNLQSSQYETKNDRVRKILVHKLNIANK